MFWQDELNQRHGGLAINVTNAIFVNGALDPDSELQIKTHPTATVFNIEGLFEI